MLDGEREFVGWLRETAAQTGPPVSRGIGDDLAGLDLAGMLWVGSDLLLDGVHFDSSRHDWHTVGRKAAGCCLSDCAAMAVQPRAAIASLAWPTAARSSDARTLMRGVIEHLAEFDAALIGGDTTSWNHPAAIDITILAQPFPKIEPVQRSGAKSGDGVFVTGALGGSIRGKHLSFVPRVNEARVLAETLGTRLHAMMDITDGLAIDLDRLADASGVGAVLSAGQLDAIASDAARELAGEDGKDEREHVLRDGEDYELLVVGEIDTTIAAQLNLTRVGAMIESAGLYLESADGTRSPLETSGYEHA